MYRSGGPAAWVVGYREDDNMMRQSMWFIIIIIIKQVNGLLNWSYKQISKNPGALPKAAIFQQYKEFRTGYYA